MSRISSDDIYLFHQGTLHEAWRSMGAHPEDGGFRFTLWAPDVQAAAVSGSFSSWAEVPMEPIPGSGIWTAFVPEAKAGDLYKYVITAENGEKLFKADPYAFASERRPGTASRLYGTGNYLWGDGDWLAFRETHSHFSRPMNIYELHAGSWRRKAPDGGNEEGFLTWRELADQLVPYLKDMGWNYLELLPVAEHPLDASWGYQVTGFYAPTARYGEPDGLRYLIDRCHQEKIGVILDWVPGHFCRDAQGLGRFNGRMLYESADHPQWGTYRFDFARPEVRSFLISNACYWLDEFHVDGLRVDGVSSMLYLNFGVEDNLKKRYNKGGGEEDTDAIEFLRTLAAVIGRRHPGCFTAAEESSAWPLVTRPAHEGGLGFHYKWDMGWMNDTLRYFSRPFAERAAHHNELTFSMMYHFSENFVLPLSHDEVVHGKLSLLGRMPGDYDRQFAGLRLLFAYQMLHPGAKLTFMGSETAPFIEWREYEELQWFMLGYPRHREMQEYVRALNRFYLKSKALWQDDFSWDGFHWLDADNAAQNVLLFTRSGRRGGAQLVCVLNMSPYRRDDYRIGVPYPGRWHASLCSDDVRFGGTGAMTEKSFDSDAVPLHGCADSVRLTLPPLGAVVLRCLRRSRP